MSKSDDVIYKNKVIIRIYFLYILVLAQNERVCDRKIISYRESSLFCSVTFRSIRICPNHIGRVLCFEVLSFRLRMVGFMGSIYHVPTHPGVYHGGWRWENSVKLGFFVDSKYLI